MYCKKIGFLCFAISLICLCSVAMAADHGLNLPPTQGSSNSGAFEAGVLSYNYTNSNVYYIKNKGFTHIRVPINVETANNAAALNKIYDYFGQVGYNGVICMFDTKQNGEGSHGNGRPNDCTEMGLAWRKIHDKFKNEPNVKYEIFNEPFGYSGSNRVDDYLDDMEEIIATGNLPESRCILDGLGYASDVQAIKNHWKGFLAYHFYPNWVAEGSSTQSAYSNKFQNDLAGVSNRTYITEFGANLSLGNYYNTYTNNTSWWGQNVNCLRGMHDAVIAFKNQGKAVKATYHWHGWHNSDTYDVWHSANSFGAAKVQSIQNDS